MTPVPNLGRRAFLAGTTGIAAASLIGCAGNEPTSTPDSGGAGGSIEQFTAAFQGNGASEGLDPGIHTAFIDEARMRALYDYLFELDDTLTPVPRLAESAEANETGDVWRVRLRDARWHDGTKLTSADVLYTISRVLGPVETKAFAAGAAMQIVDLPNCREVDDQTVELALKTPNFEFPTQLGVYGMRIIKNGTVDFTTKPVGTGPFVFESFTAGTEMSATAYADYWDGAPLVQRLTILSSDRDARVNAIQSGQVDYVDDLTAAGATQLEAVKGISVRRIPNCQIYSFIMKTFRSPFDDPVVREALFTAFDREELVRVALEGDGQVGNDLFGPGFRYYAGDIPQRVFDPDASRAALARAGRDELAFSLFTAPAASGFPEAAALVVDQAARGGIRIQLDQGAKDTYYSEVKERGDITMSRSGPMPLPNHFAMRLKADAPQNYGKWQDREFNDLYSKALATKDDDARTKVYHDMQRIMHERGNWIVYGTAPLRNAVSEKYRLAPAPTNTTGYARFDKVQLA